MEGRGRRALAGTKRLVITVKYGNCRCFSHGWSLQLAASGYSTVPTIVESVEPGDRTPRTCALDHQHYNFIIFGNERGTCRCRSLPRSSSSIKAPMPMHRITKTAPHYTGRHKRVTSKWFRFVSSSSGAIDVSARNHSNCTAKCTAVPHCMEPCGMGIWKWSSSSLSAEQMRAPRTKAAGPRCSGPRITEILKLFGRSSNMAWMRIPRDNNNWTLLYCASQQGYREVAQVLLEHGEDVNPRDDRNKTPLHLVSRARTPWTCTRVQYNCYCNREQGGY